MKSLWKKFDERMGHQTYGFAIDILGLPRKWVQMWNYKRKQKKALDARRADAEFARWFVNENKNLKQEQMIAKLKDELRSRQGMEKGAAGTHESQGP